MEEGERGWGSKSQIPAPIFGKIPDTVRISDLSMAQSMFEEETVYRHPG
jgi:hypothetical protein